MMPDDTQNSENSDFAAETVLDAAPTQIDTFSDSNETTKFGELPQSAANTVINTQDNNQPTVTGSTRQFETENAEIGEAADQTFVADSQKDEKQLSPSSLHTAFVYL